MSALPRTALWLAAYVGASLLGRALVIQPENVGLVWPAAGIALVWIASSPRRMLAVDLVLVSVSTLLVLALTEGGVARSVLSLSVVVQALLALWLMRRFVPGIWGTGGRVPFTRLAEFGRLLAAVIVAALATVVLRSVVGALLFETESLDLVGGRFGRQGSAMATIGILGLLVGGWIAQQRDRGLPVISPLGKRDLAHLLAITAATALLFVGFYRNPEIPTTYILSLTVVWAALRFGPILTGVQSLITGVVTVAMTIEGYGPIANVPSPQTRAVLAQLFVVVLMVTGLTIALIRRQITETIGRLERSEESLARRADELDLRANELDLVMAHRQGGARQRRAAHRLRQQAAGRLRPHQGGGGGGEPPLPTGRAVGGAGAEPLCAGHGRRGRRRGGVSPHASRRTGPGAGGVGLPGAERGRRSTTRHGRRPRRHLRLDPSRVPGLVRRHRRP